MVVDSAGIVQKHVDIGVIRSTKVEVNVIIEDEESTTSIFRSRHVPRMCEAE